MPLLSMITPEPMLDWGIAACLGDSSMPGSHLRRKRLKPRIILKIPSASRRAPFHVFFFGPPGPKNSCVTSLASVV